MANTLNYAELYQGFIDEELEHRSYTEWMTPNEDMIRYEGGKDVKIAQLSVSGLGDYDANASSAYPKGSVQLVWNTYSFEMDRAVQFMLGRTDPSDSGFIATTENVTRTFARTKLVPEQDMYRFHKVYSKLLTKSELTGHIKTLTGDMTASDAIPTVMELFLKVREDSDDDQNFICFMALDNEPLFREISKNNHNDIQWGKTVTVNGVSYRCMMLNELPVVFVPSKRLQTVLKINDGRTAGQEVGGIVADPTSKQIEFLILSSEAAIALGKVDSLKVIDCEEQQTSDETTINYHYLYDCWLLDNRLASCAAAVQGAASVG